VGWDCAYLLWRFFCGEELGNKLVMRDDISIKKSLQIEIDAVSKYQVKTGKS